MALDKATLKTGIINLTKQLFDDSVTMTPEQAREVYAEGLSNLFEAFVKSGDGVYQPGKLTAGTTAVTATGIPVIKIQ